jgi:hypothetical protein
VTGRLQRSGVSRWRPDTAALPTAAFLAAVLVGAAVVAVVVGSGAGSGDGGTAPLRLEIVDHGRSQVVHTRTMAPGETFQLAHTHSVTRRTVVETFSVTVAGVAMEELWFDEFGPNLPVGPEEVNGARTTFLSENGSFRVLHHGRLLPTVPLRVGGPEVDHVLTFADGTRLRLLEVAAPAAFVEFRVAAD